MSIDTTETIARNPFQALTREQRDAIVAMLDRRAAKMEERWQNALGETGRLRAEGQLDALEWVRSFAAGVEGIV